jgi:hypothetical protein
MIIFLTEAYNFGIILDVVKSVSTTLQPRMTAYCKRRKTTCRGESKSI